MGLGLDMVFQQLDKTLAAKHSLYVYFSIRLLLEAGKSAAAPGACGIGRRRSSEPSNFFYGPPGSNRIWCIIHAGSVYAAAHSAGAVVREA